jgi:hypothetical protein
VTLVTVRRLQGGKFLVTYLRSLDGENVVAITPVDLWRRGKRKREVGGPVPKPFKFKPHPSDARPNSHTNIAKGRAKTRKPPRPAPDES